jgi:hypothetical protein
VLLLLVKNNFHLCSTYASAVLSPLDGGATFAPLFINHYLSVGIATTINVLVLGINNVSLTAKPATVAAATAGIAADTRLIPAVMSLISINNSLCKCCFTSAVDSFQAYQILTSEAPNAGYLRCLKVFSSIFL